jgi:hypothetical protein
MTLTKTATVIDTSTIFTFVITNDGSTVLHRFNVMDSSLGDLTDQFPLFLVPGETVVVEITVLRVEPCDNTVWAQYESVPRSLLVFVQAECTPDGQLTFLDAVQLDGAGAVFTAEPITFHVCEGDVVAAGCDGASATHVATRNSNPSGPIPVTPGTHTVCVVEPAGFEADAECKKADVPAGGSVTFTFITTPVGDGEGCTPGFWKNHPDAWLSTAFSPGDDFDATFGRDAFNPDITLQEALELKGGGLNRLARTAAAALLNASSTDVNYPLSVAEVIDKYQAAFDSGNKQDVNNQGTEFDDFNNLSSTCPANNS